MTAQALAVRHAHDASQTVQMIKNFRNLRSKNKLSIGELDLATEAALLSLHTSFETFVRELYLECAIGAAGMAGVRSRLRAATPEEAQALIAGDRQFLEWLPVTKTVDRALVHLRAGQPFVRLWGRQQILRHLDLMQVVRNRVAHSGEQAQRIYERQVSKGDVGFDRPARWLLHAPAGKTNFEFMAEATIAACKDLSADSRTPQMLGPAVATGGQRGAPGTYRCEGCQRIQHLREWGVIQSCPHCAKTTKCLACARVNATASKWTLEALKAVR